MGFGFTHIKTSGKDTHAKCFSPLLQQGEIILRVWTRVRARDEDRVRLRVGFRVGFRVSFSGFVLRQQSIFFYLSLLKLKQKL